jgi:hypothetical protein
MTCKFKFPAGNQIKKYLLFSGQIRFVTFLYRKFSHTAGIIILTAVTALKIVYCTGPTFKQTKYFRTNFIGMRVSPRIFFRNASYRKKYENKSTVIILKVFFYRVRFQNNAKYFLSTAEGTRFLPQEF